MSESAAETPTHIFFVIHGMGKPALDAMPANLAALGKTFIETLAEEFEKTETAKAQFIAVEWWRQLHDLDTVDHRMKCVTLPTCTIMRQTINEVLADALYYFTSFHGQNVLNIVTKILNGQYCELIAKYPDFNGKIALMGHSLGGVICYDILSNQHSGNSDDNEESNPSYPLQQTHFPIKYPKLNFTPDFLFAMGSPIAATLIMRGQSYKTYSPPDSVAFYNVFNLYDPLAYRMEPLINERYVEISPVLWQRPSASAANRHFQFSYYREMIATYVPDLGIAKQFNESMESLPRVMINLGIPVFSLPDIPVLLKAQIAFQERISSIYESVPRMPTSIPIPTIWKTASGGSTPEVPKKRMRIETDDPEPKDDAHLSKKIHLQGYGHQSPGFDGIDRPIYEKSDERPIKFAKSRKNDKLTDTSETPRSPFLDQMRSMIRGDWSWPSIHHSPWSHPGHQKEAHDFGEELTAELVKAAEEAQINLHDGSESPQPKSSSFFAQRRDFFLQTPVIDSQIHQYLVGLHAHFCYWENKDMMYHIIKLMNADIPKSPK